MRGADRKSTSLSRRLRTSQTDAEARLWQHLRNRQLCGCKFVRQEPIGPYVCDFVCRERSLIVEADGGQHAESLPDARRDTWLAARGYRIMRFWNHEILSNLDGVLETIAAALEE